MVVISHIGNVGHFTHEVCRKVVFNSIVFSSTHNGFKCGNGHTSALHPEGLVCATEKHLRGHPWY